MLADLKKPEIIKLFDRDKDGKADLIGSNPGWNSEKIINHHLKVYGLGGSIEQIQGEYNVLVGDTVARYKAGRARIPLCLVPEHGDCADVAGQGSGVAAGVEDRLAVRGD